MSGLTRLELWTDYRAANGKRRALISPQEVLACTEDRNVLENINTMALSIRRDSPAVVTLDTPAGTLNTDKDKVLYALYSDGEEVERRIETCVESDEQGDTRLEITAHGPIHDLGNRGMCYRQGAFGFRTYNFLASNYTLWQHLTNYIYPAIAEAGQGYWGIGVTEDEDRQVTIQYTNDSPLAAIRKLQTELQLELKYTYSPGGLILLHWLKQVGSEAPVVRLRGGANVVKTGLSRSAADQTNRIYAFGAGDEELGQANMNTNAYAIAAFQNIGQPTERVLVQGPAGVGGGPISFDGQFADGTYRLVPFVQSRTHYLITDSKVADQSFGVTPILNSTASRFELSWYRLFHGQHALSYVESIAPGEQIRVGSIEENTASPTVNFAIDPIQQMLTSGALSFWGHSSSGVSLTIQNNPLFYRTGVRSLLATFTQFSNVQLSTVQVTLIQGALSYFGDVYVTQGQMTVQIVVLLQNSQVMLDGVSRNALTYPRDYRLTHPVTDLPVVQSQKLNEWERLGLENVHDCLAYPPLQVIVQFIPTVLPTTAYIDCAQVTNTRTHKEITVGSGANDLIDAANERLASYKDVSESIDVDTLDMSTVNDDRFPSQSFELGGVIQVAIPRLQRVIGTRTMGWRRDWLKPESLAVQISNDRLNFISVMTARQPPTPVKQLVTGGAG